MVRITSLILTAIVTSLYFFPFEFKFLEGVNTKMMLAAIGLVLLGVNLARSRDSLVNRGFFWLSIIACIVSVISYAAAVMNDTPDYTYATYIVTMWVWLGGAYTVTRLIKAVHGRLSVELVCDYLIAICVAQCTIAIVIDHYPILGELVSRFLSGEGYMGTVEKRMHGIGCALDVAGMRFSAILVMIAHICSKNRERLSVTQISLYILSFIFISIVGNMIGRTTTIGVIVAIAYAASVYFFSKDRPAGYGMFIKCAVLSLAIVIPFVVHLYNSNPSFRSNMRFAFEGFFSIVEKGKWESNTTDILYDMVVFPDNAKTWIIGDGYFENPRNSDPYFTGKVTGGFYMQTDIGYLRFIFYFGLFGLLAFSFYMMAVADVCVKMFRTYKPLIITILLLNFIIWLKVSSDLFLVFALFLCISEDDESRSLGMTDEVL